MSESEAITRQNEATLSMLDVIRGGAYATSYCDKIAATIFDALKAPDPDGIIVHVGPVQWDLHPEGYLLSPKKTLEVTDLNGNRYLVTIEDLR